MKTVRNIKDQQAAAAKCADGMRDDYIDATGGFVTDEMCKALVMNELYPKNLVDKVKAATDPQAKVEYDEDTSTVKVKSLADKELDAKTMKLRLQKEFSSSTYPFRLFEEHLPGVLKEEGFTPYNTMTAACVCPEVRTFMLADGTASFVPGEGPFLLGALGGLPASEGRVRTLVALSPREGDGALFVVCASHIGVTETGKLGEVERGKDRNNSKVTNLCPGPARAAFAALLEDDKYEHDRADREMYDLHVLVKTHFDRIATCASPMVELASVVYEEARSRLCAYLDAASDRRVAFLGGIQVNTPPKFDDYFVLKHFEVRRRGGVPRDLREKLERVVDPDKFLEKPREPDWPCRACGLMNADELVRCRKCGSRRPGHGMASPLGSPMARRGGGGGGGLGSPGSPGGRKRLGSPTAGAAAGGAAGSSGSSRK